MEDRLETPDEIRRRIWRELARATQDRHHAWRTPVLATCGDDGVPNARVVVLRHADESLGRLDIYTDRRSPKVAELGKQPQALLVFWSKRLSWQLRVRAQMEIQAEGPQVDAVWERVSQSAAAGDYLSAQAPGAALAGTPADTPAPDQNHHLALLCAHVQEIDWLELLRAGHRRARLGVQSWDWLTP